MDGVSGLYLSNGGSGSISLQASSSSASSSQLFDFVSVGSTFRIIPIEDNDDGLEKDEERPCQVGSPCATRNPERARRPCKAGKNGCPSAEDDNEKPRDSKM